MLGTVGTGTGTGTGFCFTLRDRANLICVVVASPCMDSGCQESLAFNQDIGYDGSPIIRALDQCCCCREPGLKISLASYGSLVFYSNHRRQTAQSNHQRLRLIKPHPTHTSNPPPSSVSTPD